jgi:hypothetical protein
MELSQKPRQRDIPPVIRHIFRSERVAGRDSNPTCCKRFGVLAELERYPELRH